MKPPILRYGSQEDLKARASLKGGRYWFTFSESATHLFEEDLEYSPGEEVPFALFKALVITRDAYLPSSNDPVELASDLLKPNNPCAPEPEDVYALVRHLSGNAYTSSQIEALKDLATEIERRGGIFSLEGVEDQSDRIENLQSIAEELYQSSQEKS